MSRLQSDDSSLEVIAWHCTPRTHDEASGLDEVRLRTRRVLLDCLRRKSVGEALRAWCRIADALAAPESANDRHLAHEIRGFVQRQPVVQAVLQQRQREAAPRPDPALQRGRSGPEIGR